MVTDRATSVSEENQVALAARLQQEYGSLYSTNNSIGWRLWAANIYSFSNLDVLAFENVIRRGPPLDLLAGGERATFRRIEDDNSASSNRTRRAEAFREEEGLAIETAKRNIDSVVSLKNATMGQLADISKSLDTAATAFDAAAASFSSSARTLRTGVENLGRMFEREEKSARDVVTLHESMRAAHRVVETPEAASLAARVTQQQDFEHQ